MQTNLSTSPNLSFQTSHSRWLALINRDPSSHSSFLYGVKSTKIYCRPTCPARLARRANVVFYDTAEQARRDGYRPCKRCRPDNAGFVGVGEELVSRVIALMRVERVGHYQHQHQHHHLHDQDQDHDGEGEGENDDGLTMMKRSVKDLAHEVGVSPSYLCRVFKKRMGVTIGTYMMEFEREVVETDGNGERLIPADTPRSPPLAPESLGGGLVGPPALESSGEALDLNFDFDEWFWAEDFVNDRVIECAG